METLFELNIFSVLFAALNFVFFVGVILGVAWVVRRLKAISALERRVSALEARLRDQDR